MFVALICLCISGCIENEPAPEVELNDFQTEALNYFDDVALGFEGGNTSEVTRRWESPIVLYVGGNFTQRQYNELIEVVSELNELITPTSSISITSDLSQNNSYLHLGSADSFIDLFPSMEGLLNRNVGYFNVWWSDDILNESRIFVDNDRTEFEEQRSLIREELAQSLGLGKDSPLYPNSVFYETSDDGGYAPSFSDLDREIIRLLYHPDMSVGLDFTSARNTIRQIYSDENSN